MGSANERLTARKTAAPMAKPIQTTRRAAFLPKYSLMRSVRRNVTGKVSMPAVWTMASIGFESHGTRNEKPSGTWKSLTPVKSLTRSEATKSAVSQR